MCIYVCIGFCLIFFHWTLWCKISINNVITTNGVWHSYVPSDKSNDISQVISKHTIIWSDLDLNVVWAFQISVCFSNWLWFMTLLSVSYLDFSLENIHINLDCPSDWPWYECVCRSDIFAVHYHYSLGCPGRGGAGRHSCIVKYAALSCEMPASHWVKADCLALVLSVGSCRSCLRISSLVLTSVPSTHKLNPQLTWNCGPAAKVRCGLLLTFPTATHHFTTLIIRSFWIGKLEMSLLGAMMIGNINAWGCPVMHRVTAQAEEERRRENPLPLPARLYY